MIDIGDVKGHLENMAYRANDLAKRLSDEGKPMSPEDQELCRLALLPRFMELSDMLKVEYITGSTQRFEHLMESLVEFPMFMSNLLADQGDKRRKR